MQEKGQFDADNLLLEEDNESKLEDLEAELKSNRQEWNRSSQPSVSDVLEFSSASKERICNTDVLL